MPDAPRTRLQVLQRGVESAEGVLVPATRRVPFEPGSLDLSANEVDSITRGYSGSLAEVHQSSTGLERAGLRYRQRGFYDELALDLTMFFGPAVITGGGADKTWTYLPPDAADTLKRWSYEAGGKDAWPEEERIAGCVGSRLTLSWNKADDWMESLELVAVRNTQGAKAAGLDVPAVLVPILGRLTRVYIDPTTFGSGSYGRAISGEITIETGVSRRYGSDGNAYPNRVAVIGPRVVGASAIVEYDSTTLRDAYRDSTLQKLRVEVPGPALGGSAYNARFDIAGKWRAAPIADDDGITTLALELGSEFNDDLGAEIAAVVVCSLAGLPEEAS